jgi:hypothetical protein
LDVDMSGMPYGPKAAFATRGYFAGQYHRRGRQLGCVFDPLLCSQCTSQFVNVKMANTHQWHAASQADLPKKMGEP